MQRQAKKKVASYEARGASLEMRALATRNSPLATRPALTLIELLVTIVIMVTVLAGVIPLMSPNNNARKIREASRQLSTLLAQAQAQAARDGRPAGVAFREFETGATRNGVAVEAFMINEPQPFAGFSDASQARLLFQNGLVTEVQLVLAGALIASPQSNPDACYALDNVPPDTIRFGDVISVSGFDFVITDPDRDGDGAADTGNGDPVFTRGDFYTDSRAQFKCNFLGSSPPVPRAAVPPRQSALPDNGWAHPAPYRILRQPRNTSDAPLQFPRGIGVDLDVSGATGPNVPNNFDSGGVADVVGIMFNPNGTLEGLYHNGERTESAAQIFLLMGVIENANNGSQDPNDYDFKNYPVTDADNLAQRRSRINWLNADSRWVTVNRAGRIVTSANNIFDPTLPAFTTDPPFDTSPNAPSEARQQRNRQIDAARSFASQMQTEGGR